MKSRYFSCVVAVALLMTCFGCGTPPTPAPGPTPTPTPVPPIETPAMRILIAQTAGQVAFLTFVAIEQPTAAQQTAITAALTQVRNSVTGFQTSGFISALPAVEAELATVFPDPADAAQLTLANTLAEDILAGLDSLYSQHPTWAPLTTEVTGLIGAFLDGATAGDATLKASQTAHLSRIKASAISKPKK